MSDGLPPQPRSRRTWRWLAYLVLLLASHLYLALRPSHHPGSDVHFATVERTLADGSPESLTLAYLEWTPPEGSSPRPPVLLLHGSPGSAGDWSRVGPLLAHEGYRVIAVDLPGFGDSSHDLRDYSIRGGGAALLGLLDTLHIDRAHVVGWSNGGGAAMHLADLAPERVASLSLVGSIGLQRYEGSGDYHFEHFKYALAYAAFVVAPEAIPHFGLLGPRSARYAFVRNFWDSDQRPLESIMRRLEVPTLILHGRRDILIPARAAEAHAQLISTSRLFIINANHFIPFTHAPLAAHVLTPFLARHDTPGVPALTGSINFAPARPRRGLLHVLEPLELASRASPWYVQTSAIGKIVLVMPTVGVLGASLLVAASDLDPFVALVGIAMGLITQTLLIAILGRAVGPRLTRVPWLGTRLPAVSAADWLRRMQTRPAVEGWSSIFVPGRRLRSLTGASIANAPFVCFVRYTLARLLAAILWAIVSFFIAMLGMALVVRPLGTRLGFFGEVAGVALLAIAVSVAPALLLRTGRQVIWGRFGRWLHHEYWPAKLFYLPLGPYMLWLARRWGGLTVPTCVNPGIENGGGLVGESKSAIMRRLGNSPFVLPTILIEPADPQSRVRQLRDVMQQEPRLAFPLILKPDAGQRGFAVRLVHSHDDALRYFQEMSAPAVAQPYAPGPHECGIAWARRVPDSPAQAPSGAIFSITRKEFPILLGDGRSTLEELILAHPRYRKQANVFLERHAAIASSIPALHERIRLSVAGNHAQGTLFRDGADLITPALEEAINRLSLGYEGGGLDFGRYDVRYESDEALRAGRGFSIVELNGVTGESTNLYDPDRSFFWAYRVLFRQWRTLYELGAWRASQGCRPLSLTDIRALWREHVRTRRGRALSD